MCVGSRKAVSKVSHHKAPARTATLGPPEAFSSIAAAIALCVSHQHRVVVLLLWMSESLRPKLQAKPVATRLAQQHSSPSKASSSVTAACVRWQLLQMLVEVVEVIAVETAVVVVIKSASKVSYSSRLSHRRLVRQRHPQAPARPLLCIIVNS